jgi:hypothetical protein
VWWKEWEINSYERCLTSLQSTADNPEVVGELAMLEKHLAEWRRHPSASSISRLRLGGGSVEGLAFGEDVVGDAAEFADDAEPGEDFQGVEG